MWQVLYNTESLFEGLKCIQIQMLPDPFHIPGGKNTSLPVRISQVPVMGAEDEGSQPPPPTAGDPAPAARAPPITPAQFLSWKQRKVPLFSVP